MHAKSSNLRCLKIFNCLFIRLADLQRFKGLKTALNNQFLLDKDAYPLTLSEALKLLKNDKVPGQGKDMQHQPQWESGLAFAQAGKAGKSNKEFRSAHKDHDCFGCGKAGHLMFECPTTSEKDKKKKW